MQGDILSKIRQPEPPTSQALAVQTDTLSQSEGTTMPGEVFLNQ